MASGKGSRSAQVVAAERAVLADLDLLDDPYARAMLDGPVRLAYGVARRWPQRIPTLPLTLAGLAARVRWHDERLDRAIANGVAQVAIVGAGFDSRAWRLGVAGVRFFELDHPATQRVKRARAPSGGPTYVPIDLATDDVVEALARGGVDLQAPIASAVEGVTMYLPDEVVRRQLASLARAVRSGSTLSIDFYPPQHTGTAAQVRQNRLQRIARSGSDERLQLLVDRRGAVDLVESCGWRVDEVAGAREAAEASLPATCGLPIDAVNDGKTLLAATRP